MMHNMNNMITKKDEYSIWEFIPTLSHLYIPGADNMYFQKKIRFLLNYLSGGKIYYLKCENTIIGYCMVSFGKAFHYEYASKDDITIGPIYINKEHRGKKLSTFLLNTVLSVYNEKQFAYASIHRINKQSNALFTSCGFDPISNLVIRKYTRRVLLSDKRDTDYRLYMKSMHDSPKISI